MKKQRLDKIKDMKKSSKEELKNKKFKNLTRKEKDVLLLTMAKMLGLVDEE